MNVCWKALLSINLLKEKKTQIKNTAIFAVSHLGYLEQVTYAVWKSVPLTMILRMSDSWFATIIYKHYYCQEARNIAR